MGRDKLQYIDIALIPFCQITKKVVCISTKPCPQCSSKMCSGSIANWAQSNSRGTIYDFRVGKLPVYTDHILCQWRCGQSVSTGDPNCVCPFGLNNILASKLKHSESPSEFLRPLWVCDSKKLRLSGQQHTGPPSDTRLLIYHRWVLYEWCYTNDAYHEKTDPKVLRAGAPPILLGYDTDYRI